MIKFFKIFENKTYTWKSIIDSLELDMFEDLSDFQKIKKNKYPLGEKRYDEVPDKKLLGNIIFYFEYKHNVKLSRFDYIFSTFEQTNSTIGIFVKVISKIKTTTKYNVAYVVEDKKEFVDFINNADIYLTSNKYNL